MSQIETLKKVVALVCLVTLAACKSGDNSTSSSNDKKDLPKFCPLIACAAPPDNCHYEGATFNGECIDSCGRLVCDPVECLVPDCAAPPEGCSYVNPEIVDGCPVNCGSMVCEVTCIMPMCAAPPDGCRYTGGEIVDGCPNSCGNLVCDSSI